MENKPPLSQARLADGTDEEKKERLSDTSGEPEHRESLNPVTGKPVADLPGDKIELTEEDCYDELGFSFSEWKKWFVILLLGFSRKLFTL
jgi:hypothetical protein